MAAFWRVLFRSLQDAKSSSAVAEAVTAPLLLKIDRVIQSELRTSLAQKKAQQKTEQEEEKKEVEAVQSITVIKTTLLVPHASQKAKEEPIKGDSAMLQLLMDYIVCSEPNNFAFVQDDATTKSEQGQWLIQSLILDSSQSARRNSMAILKRLLEEKELRPRITQLLLESLDESLEIAPLSSEEYFNLLTSLLTQPDQQASEQDPPKELRLATLAGGPPIGLGEEKKAPRKASAPPPEVSEETKGHFMQVFDRIDGELVKLSALEQEKKALG